MKHLVLVLTLSVPLALSGAEWRNPSTVVAMNRRSAIVVVARPGVIEGWDATSMTRRWSSSGLANPRRMAISEEDSRAALLDPLTNEVRIFSTVDGTGRTISAGETPIDALFSGRSLYVLERDAGLLERFDLEGRRIAGVAVAPDSVFLRRSGETLYVYSRLGGSIAAFSRSLVAQRSLRVAPYAADFAVSGRDGYLAYPRDGHVTLVGLDRMQLAGELSTGAVPISVAAAGNANALSAKRILVADPASKRVWEMETTQSTTQAFGRGFLRGMLGLGLFSDGAAEFPTGVDRITREGALVLAFDSSTGTLYQMIGSHSARLASGISPTGFAGDGRYIFYWDPSAGALRRVVVR